MDSRVDIGTSASISRKITEEDIEIFAALSLDRNPIHFDDNFAAKAPFRKRIAHGMIGASLVSGALTKLMGNGNIWLSLSIRFNKPIHINDKLICTLTIEQIDKRGVATIRVQVANGKGDTVISGSVQSMRFVR